MIDNERRATNVYVNACAGRSGTQQLVRLSANDQHSKTAISQIRWKGARASATQASGKTSPALPVADEKSAGKDTTRS